ncbi:MAG TPA: APC family permease [Lapillicoccus sp.]|nr:APC family permease [Lapillicoccus sp.]
MHRRLGVRDAVVIGLGSMIGAGVFSAFTPAAAAAGSGLLVGLVVAAFVAWCNATASAQLAAQYPTSGGTYVYGRERLGPWWGFAAGWGFVVGKTASCAAMALTVATYAVGGDARATRFLAIAAVVGLTVVNLRGITKTARLATVLVVLTVALLGVSLVVVGVGNRTWHSPFESMATASAYGILQSAGLLFFAFAGYARIATLGEEVRHPEKTIPRAIPRALGLVVVLYAVVGLVLLAVLGPSGVAASAVPLLAAAEQAGVGWIGAAVRVAAVLASLGALLGLVAGVSRTMLAMARERDLPRLLARVDERRGVPQAAQVAVCVVVVLLVVAFDVRAVIGFSSFGVLVYYAVANASAFTQDAAHRRWPRVLQVLGGVGCLVLVATLPWGAVVTGVCVFAVGVLGRLAVGAGRPRSQ